MEVSSSHQGQIFLLYVLSGVICGAFFDVQRFLRKKRKAGNVRVCIEDFVFGAVCVSIMLLLSYFFNNGELRYYQIMGSISGALFYGVLLSGIFLKILNIVFIVLKSVLWTPLIAVFRMILIPIRKTCCFFGRIYVRIKRIAARLKRDIKKKRKNLEKRIKML